MKEQQTLLFDAVEAMRLGIAGMEKATEAPSTHIWFAQATEKLDSEPIGWEFSADDIVGHCGLVREVTMNGNNYVGPWFGEMKLAGRIIEIGRIRSKRVSNHGKKITLWKKVW